MIPHWLLWLYNLLFTSMDSQGFPWQVAVAMALGIVLVVNRALIAAMGD